MLAIKLALLIIIANGMPVLARLLLGDRGNRPVDAGLRLADGDRLFGESKTWRGIVFSLWSTTLIAPLLGFSLLLGFVVAAGAMAGDLLSSFCKRRLGYPPSARLSLVDQLPESLLPAMMVGVLLGLNVWQVIAAVVIFVLSDIFVSPLLYRLGWRRVPH